MARLVCIRESSVPRRSGRALGAMLNEHRKGLNAGTLTGLSVALSAAIIVALARIPRTATVSNLQFFLICAGTFASFFAISLLAKLGLTKALRRTIIYSCATLFAAAAIAAIVHEVLRL